MLPIGLKSGDWVTIVNNVQSGFTLGARYQITSMGFTYLTITDDYGYTRNFSDDYLNKKSRLYMMRCERLERFEKLKEIGI